MRKSQTIFRHKKHEEWPSCLAHMLKCINRAKDWWILNKTFRISEGTLDICSGSWRQKCHLCLESDSDHPAFHQSSHYNMAARLNSYGAETMGGGTYTTVWNPLYCWLNRWVQDHTIPVHMYLLKLRMIIWQLYCLMLMPCSKTLQDDQPWCN